MRLNLKCLDRDGVYPPWTTLSLCLGGLMCLFNAGRALLSFWSHGRKKSRVFYLTLTELSQDHLCTGHWFQDTIGFFRIIWYKKTVLYAVLNTVFLSESFGGCFLSLVWWITYCAVKFVVSCRATVLGKKCILSLVNGGFHLKAAKVKWAANRLTPLSSILKVGR